MIELFLLWWQQLDPRLLTVLIAMLPVLELRASIPIAITVFDLPPMLSFVLSVTANGIMLIVLLRILRPLWTFVEEHVSVLHKWQRRVGDRLHAKHHESYDRYGALLLFFIVAVPIPGSGIWTGSLLAVLFSVKDRYALPAMLLGTAVSGLIVLLLTTGTINLLAN